MRNWFIIGDHADKFGKNRTQFLRLAADGIVRWTRSGLTDSLYREAMIYPSQISSGSSQMSLSTDDKFPILDGLRAISILLVLADHLLPLGPKILQLNATAGSMGMSLFFALSGFLITSGLIKNPNISEFMARRLARILPLAYVYTMVVFLVL